MPYSDNRLRVYLYFLLQCQLPLQTHRHHLVGDGKLFWNLFALSDDDGVAAVQKLVAEHEVLLPVSHHVL